MAWSDWRVVEEHVEVPGSCWVDLPDENLDGIILVQYLFEIVAGGLNRGEFVLSFRDNFGDDEFLSTHEVPVGCWHTVALELPNRRFALASTKPHQHHWVRPTLSNSHRQPLPLIVKKRYCL